MIPQSLINSFINKNLSNIAKKEIPKIIALAKTLDLEEGETAPGITFYPKPDTEDIYFSIITFGKKGEIKRYVFTANLIEFIEKQGFSELKTLLLKPDPNE